MFFSLGFMTKNLDKTSIWHSMHMIMLWKLQYLHHLVIKAGIEW